MNTITRSDWEDDFNSEAEYIEYLKTAANQILKQVEAGEIVSVDPDVADFMGAIEENAISEEDALLSMEFDVAPDPFDEEIEHGETGND
jgi:hypothetical protein